MGIALHPLERLRQGEGGISLHYIVKHLLFLVNTSLAECVLVGHSTPLDFVGTLHIQSGSRAEHSVKGGAMAIWLALFWTGPIGIGIFLVSLGGMIYLLKKADEVDKRTKAFEREKGLEKK